MVPTPLAVQRVYESASLPQAPFRSQHTKATVKRDEKSNRFCKADGCEKQATFGSPLDGVTISCKAHKQEGHVDVLNKRCEAVGCDKKPVFGSPVDRVTRFCKVHKKDDHVDVANKLCEADGCEKRANYGSEAVDLVHFCKAHSNNGDVLSRLRCVAPGCDGPRSFGAAANGVALRCTEHRGQEFTSRKMLRVMARARADAVQASSNAHS